MTWLMMPFDLSFSKAVSFKEQFFSCFCRGPNKLVNTSVIDMVIE